MSDISRLPAPLIEHWDWQVRGACRREGSKLFFAPDEERPARRSARERAAKAVCRRCAVIEECREYAVAAVERYGIWGGLTEPEREDLRQDAPTAPARPPSVDAGAGSS